jgi:acyl carrier protein
MYTTDGTIARRESDHEPRKPTPVEIVCGPRLTDRHDSGGQRFMGGTPNEIPANIRETLRSFLARVDKDAEFDRATPLFAEGLGLDSLETAELSAVLEDEFGTDAFAGETMPQTVGDIVAFYDAAVRSA